MQDTPSTNRYLTAAQVCARFGGISTMSLWRWLKKDELGFPKPMTINGRRFFREDEILDWETRRSVESAA